MPSRAFLLFGHEAIAEAAKRLVRGFNALAGIFAFRTLEHLFAQADGAAKFQCPRGHFCFSDSHASRAQTATRRGFNALAGIFAFRTRCLAGRYIAHLEFQCPRGHFCFSDFHLSHTLVGGMMCFNALAGIFAFRTRRARGGRRAPAPVSMPSRAFLLFGHDEQSHLIEWRSEFQCPRGHFCFSDLEKKFLTLWRYEMFQCPRGHFCFSDLSLSPLTATWRLPGFNALAGIFAFRTKWTPTALSTSSACFNALAGIFAFRT